MKTDKSSDLCEFRCKKTRTEFVNRNTEVEDEKWVAGRVELLGIKKKGCSEGSLKLQNLAIKCVLFFCAKLLKADNWSKTSYFLSNV